MNYLMIVSPTFYQTFDDLIKSQNKADVKNFKRDIAAAMSEK